MKPHYGCIRMHLLFLSVLVLLLICSESALAQPDSTAFDTIAVIDEQDSTKSDTITVIDESDSIVFNSNIVTADLFVGHLNFDGVQDTVIGRSDRGLGFLPWYISWGAIDSASEENIQDGRPREPHPPRLDRTYFTYPRWNTISGSATFQRLNSQDSLTDIILFLWGTVQDGNGVRDTGQILALFGQQALNTQSKVRIDEVGEFKSSPFFAMRLDLGEELVETGFSDPGGVMSFTMPSLPVEVREDSASPPPRTDSIVTNDGYMVSIYPNPVHQTAHVAASVVPAGEYHVVVTAVNGQIAHRQDVTVPDSGELLRTLDLRALTGGYYLVVIYSNERQIGSYPIIITK